ncbi:MAG: GNAT family N-acetyltransferase [Salibacteraceae bacterium]
MEFKIEESGSKGEVTAVEAGKTLGTMTYSVAGEHLIIIDHTDVAPEGQGKAIGKRLLFTLVEELRASNRKAMPLCPFANAMFKKLPEIRDVLS